MGIVYSLFLLVNPNLYQEQLKSERLIDNDLKIYIGLVYQTDDLNPYSAQAIKIGTNNVKRLETFIETTNGLIYKFEDNIELILSKREDDIFIGFKNGDEKIITTKMNRIIRKLYKQLFNNQVSLELNKIYDFIHISELD